MGIDMYASFEVKVKGRWEHYLSHIVPREFGFFEAARRLGKPGFPDDCNIVTLIESGRTPCKDPAYLGIPEIQELEDMVGLSRYKQTFGGFFFGSVFSSMKTYRGETRRIRNLGVEDVRMIFWFDGKR